ncbi:GGDEF domain-containing protein [Noviherbaspirillum pedocola]|uniref:GGDEF domain-containing protein n=1 Tax=Noviherbaspirillum pedocola TaxID=2801341 RepID=A0A934T1M9_9BURK|nr:GGDEF domain-containing protein [Noviherbaspirillum pedocola]MBK4735938.1 GGDEF domain-containing protein [Noviherbaspirillum pedocola]
MSVDALTGLADAGALAQAVDAAVVHDRKGRTVSAVLRVNLDAFSTFNEWYGRPCGDAVLKEVALRLRSTVDATCTVARLAADDFAILMPNMAHPGAVPDLANALLAAVAAPIMIGDVEYSIFASAGIALCRLRGDAGGQALDRAGAAVEASKSRCGNTLSVAPLE